MKIDLSTDEAQMLLDGINVVIKEKARDLAFFSEALALDNPDRDRVLDQFKGEMIIARAARTKIQKVS